MCLAFHKKLICAIWICFYFITIVIVTLIVIVSILILIIIMIQLKQKIELFSFSQDERAFNPIDATTRNDNTHTH